jgi:hypothetical protein
MKVLSPIVLLMILSGTYSRMFKLSEIMKYRSDNNKFKFENFHSSKYACQPHKIQQFIQISENCNKIRLTTYGCRGYCHSFTVPFDDGSSIALKSCCKIKNTIYDHLRVDCISKPVDYGLDNATNANLGTTWIPYTSPSVYEGYYMIDYVVYMNCECDSRLIN